MTNSKLGRLPIIAGLLLAVSALGVSTFLVLRQRVTPGVQENGSVVVTTNQILTPYGLLKRIEGARCKDLAVSPKGDFVAVLCTGRLCLFTIAGEAAGEVKLRTGALGLAWTANGEGVWVSGDQGQVTLVRRDGDTWAAGPSFKPDTPVAESNPKGGNAQPTGLAVSVDGKELFVALGRRNAVLRYSVELSGLQGVTAELKGSFPAQTAPYQMATDGKGMFAVSNRGGAFPSETEPRADSAGTLVAVDPKTDAALRGSVTVFEEGGSSPSNIKTGRNPSGLAFSPNGRTLAVADSDSDTVTIVNLSKGSVATSINLRPAIEPRFGHEPTGVAYSDDGGMLFVCCGGINAVAVVSTQSYQVIGHIPTAWYPIAIAQKGGTLVVACSKGIGNRLANKTTRFGVHDNVGTVQFIKLDEALKELPKLSNTVAQNNRWGEEFEARPGQPARPVPERVGEPSVFKHVVYVIKENHTYDTDFGDMEEGNGDKSLCLFGEEVTPNEHALARQFALLDNTYTSGTNSADGHQWTSTAIANAYTEQNYSANIRSYPFDGGDPLAFSPRGFLWNAATASKISVRVYGEFVDRPVVRDPQSGKTPTWKQLWDDYKSGTNKYDVHAETSQAALRSVMHPKYIGFPSEVSDQWRADQFLADLKYWESGGSNPNANTPATMPGLCVLLLPNNHTSGSSAGMPRPRSMVADNDLALGRIVDAISHSKFWSETLILVIEDDSQLGLDHVDGHRTVAQAISPYTRRKAVVSQMYNHTSFIRTMGLVLGFPALTRFDRTATPLSACFADKPDLTPFTFLLNKVPLDDLNPPAKTLSGEARRLAEASAKLDFDEVDMADAEIVARAAWHSQKPNVPFPKSAFHPNQDGDD